jgi:hypothetical protein
MNQLISIEVLATVVGGQQLSHADQLARGNGGIVPLLPLSHADQLARGNGGIVPLLPLSHAQQLARGNGGVAPKL